MEAAIFTGGPDINTDVVSGIVSDCDLIYAADSGAETALSCGITPAKVIGDMDSIDPDTLVFLNNKGVSVDVYPAEKDMSDAELCINEIPAKAEIILVCSFSGRPDHALANMMLAVKTHSEGREITLTDGVSDFIPLSGFDSMSVEGVQDPENVAISLIPFTKVTGVTTSGLYYELKDASLTPGSTYSISNKLKSGEDSFEVRISDGKLGVMIVPN